MNNLSKIIFFYYALAFYWSLWCCISALLSGTARLKRYRLLFGTNGLDGNCEQI